MFFTYKHSHGLITVQREKIEAQIHSLTSDIQH